MPARPSMSSVTPSQPAKGRFHLRCTVLLLLPALFFASGMNGANCQLDLPGVTSGVIVGRPTILDTDHVLGDANAQLTVVEYFDFQCPFCGRFAREVFPGIKTAYIDTGKVRWVWRHFPLGSHDRAVPAAEASECAADQDKFVEYHDDIYSSLQNVASGDIGGALQDDDLKKYATNVGLDRTTFDACADGDSKSVRVQTDRNSGIALGVGSTPTFIVDNELIAGFRTADQLKTILDRKLAGG